MCPESNEEQREATWAEAERRTTIAMHNLVEKYGGDPFAKCGNGCLLSDCDCFVEREAKPCQPEDDGTNGLSDFERNR